MQDKYEELLEKQNKVEKRLKQLPNGKLRITHTRGQTSYYLLQDGKEQYLSRKDKETISQLAQRSYLERLNKELLYQIKEIKHFLQNYSETSLFNIYNTISDDRKILIDPLFLSNEEYAERWQKKSYQPKQFAEDANEFITNKGERVRSKSEKIIADRLYYLNIPYKYECPLDVKGYGVLYPDFTVLNVHTRKEYYWEHFGMMDNQQYSEHAFRKLDTYQNGGIVPGKKLIITYETTNKPLNIKFMNRIIDEYFG